MPKRLLGVIRHGAAVVGAADRGRADPMCRRGLDRAGHREVSPDLTHGVAAVDDDAATDLPDDARPPPRVDPAAAELLDILGDADNAMGMDATQVGRDERVGEQACILFRHPATRKDRTDEARQRCARQTPLDRDCQAHS